MNTTNTTSHCREYCETLAEMLKGNGTPKGFRWNSLYAFMSAKAVNMPENAVVTQRLGTMKQCYRNATIAVLRQRKDGPLIYCEGHAIPSDVGIPMDHAWLYDMDKQTVIETTWTKPGFEYFGIAFNREFLRTQIKGRKYYGLINAWDVDFPLLSMTDEELTNAFHPVMEQLTT